MSAIKFLTKHENCLRWNFLISGCILLILSSAVIAQLSTDPGTADLGQTVTPAANKIQSQILGPAEIIAGVGTARWTDNVMSFADAGTKKQVNCEGYYKSPDKAREEYTTATLIVNGDKHLLYDKAKKNFTTWDDNVGHYDKARNNFVSWDDDSHFHDMRIIFTLYQFWPIDPITHGHLSFHATSDYKGSYHGMLCRTEEMTILPRIFNNNPNCGSCHILCYLDLQTERVLGFELKQYYPDEKRVMCEETADYQYGDAINDSLFDVTPPQQAVRDELLPWPGVEFDFRLFPSVHWVETHVRYPGDPNPMKCYSSTKEMWCKAPNEY